MRVRSRNGNAIATPRKDVRGRSASRNVARARDRDAAIGALGPAQAELRNRTALRRLNHPRGLSGDKRLEADDVEQCRLQKLAIEHGARHANHRFACEHQLALGNRVDIHPGTEVGKESQESRFEQQAAARRLELGEIGDVLLGEPEVFNEFPELGGTAHDRIGVAERRLPEERREAPLLLGLIVLPQPLGHSQLI